MLPTDTMKNTVYAFAKEHGVGEPEAFALLLARHFVSTQPQIARREDHHRVVRLGAARPALLPAAGLLHPDLRGHRRPRPATQVVSGLTGLVLLNTTASEFHGFPRDRYTTLPETTDRILATAVDARWRHRAGLGPTGATRSPGCWTR